MAFRILVLLDAAKLTWLCSPSSRMDVATFLPAGTKIGESRRKASARVHARESRALQKCAQTIAPARPAQIPPNSHLLSGFFAYTISDFGNFKFGFPGENFEHICDFSSARVIFSIDGVLGIVRSSPTLTIAGDRGLGMSCIRTGRRDVSPSAASGTLQTLLVTLSTPRMCRSF